MKYIPLPMMDKGSSLEKERIHLRGWQPAKSKQSGLFHLITLSIFYNKWTLMCCYSLDLSFTFIWNVFLLIASLLKPKPLSSYMSYSLIYDLLYPIHWYRCVEERMSWNRSIINKHTSVNLEWSIQFCWWKKDRSSLLVNKGVFMLSFGGSHVQNVDALVLVSLESELKIRVYENNLIIWWTRYAMD